MNSPLMMVILVVLGFIIVYITVVAHVYRGHKGLFPYPLSLDHSEVSLNIIGSVNMHSWSVV